MKKKNIYYFMILAICLLSINIISVNASVTIKSTGNYNLNNQVWGVIKKTSKGTEMYCAQFYKNPPIDQTCDEDSDWNKNSHHAAVVGYIVNKNWTYRLKEVLINHYLGEYFSYSCSSSTCVSGVNSGKRGKNGKYPYIYIGSLSDNETFKERYNEVKKYKESLPKNDGSVKWSEKLSYSEEDKKYKGVLRVYNMGLKTHGEQYEKAYKVAFTSNNDNSLDCTVEGLKKYWPETNAGNQVYDLFVSCSKNTTGTVIATVTSNDINISKRYDCGKKYQKLITAKTEKREVSVKTKLTSTAEDTSGTECENDDLACQCKLDFETKVGQSNNRYERIKLYEEDYNEFNNLLNFNITDPTEACSSFKKESIKVGCLAVEYLNDDFNQDNLSGYDTTIDVDGRNTAYCANSFKLTSPHTDTFNSGLSTIAGNALFETKEPKALDMTSNIKCYLYGDNLSESDKNSISFDETTIELKYNNENVIELKATTTSENEGIIDNKREYSSFEKTLTEEYDFKEISYEILTGKKQSDSSSPIKTYGIASDFKDEDGYIIFQYGDSEATCPYIIESIPNGKLQLEFRTIDTKNPFPGKTGKIRTVGSNWCKIDGDGKIISCSGSASENDVVKTNIADKNNSYNKTNDGSKYSIKLTPSTIKQIRDDNKKTSYDDINLKCENDVCISNYLTKLRDKGLLSINNSENRTKVEK